MFANPYDNIYMHQIWLELGTTFVQVRLSQKKLNLIILIKFSNIFSTKKNYKKKKLGK